MLLRLALLSLLRAAAEDSPAPRIPPEHAQTLTLYHVASLAEGVVPLDMDTADINGDIFFDLRSAMLPLECASKDAWPGDCENGELVSNDLVISKLLVEVDTRFGEYGRCNECNASGWDTFSGMKCPGGPLSYFCTCGDFASPRECASKSVGEENITEVYGSFECTWAWYVRQPYACWQNNVYKKTGGMWYSTFKGAQCLNGNTAPCSWRLVHVEKVVNKTCADAAIYSAIEELDGLKCFDKCPENGPFSSNSHASAAALAKPNALERNTSSPCWIGCFYQTVLGQKGMLPYAHVGPGVEDGGVDLATLVSAWDAPFASEDAGGRGCPAIPITAYA